MKPDERFRNIELIMSDVDGVLTDGTIIYDNAGIETKKFHSLDGQGIHLWKRAGYKFGVLTARTSHIVKLRANELGIDVVRQGFEDKLPVCQEVIQELGLDASRVCYIGDDLPDLPVMRFVGVGIAVANAVAEVKQGADYVTVTRGGEGAVREVIELLLKSKMRWDELISKYVAH